MAAKIIKSPILGIGEILWDELPSGRKPGGAPFNFVFHCSQLGHPAWILSSVGDDIAGEQLLNEVRNRKMSTQWIARDAAPTGTVQVRFDDQNQPSYTITEGVAWDHISLPDQMDVTGFDVVCFGSLAQRSTHNQQSIPEIVKEIRSAIGATRICDINLRPPYTSPKVIWNCLQHADWLKLNDEELGIVAEACWLTVSEDGDLLGEFRKYAPQLQLICLTRGSRGCRVQTLSESVDLPGISITVVDPVGAGDAFTAGLVCKLQEGKSLAEAADFANRLGAWVATKEGGTPFFDGTEPQGSAE